MSTILIPRFNRIFVVLLLLFVGAAACTTASRPDLSGMTFASDPLLGKVVWHDLITEDLDGVRPFYAGLFGWTFEEANTDRTANYVIARKGNIIVAGLLGREAANDGENYSRWLPYISVDDVDAAVARSTAAGASVAVTARNVAIGRVAAIIDPQGAVIGLVRSDIGDPDDATTAAMPGRPVWTELLADDPQAAASFYTTLAGYQPRTIERRGGQYTVLASDGTDRAGIFQNPAEGDYTPVWITVFGVDDPTAAAARAVALGGTIILPVSSDLREGTTAVIADPSGALLALQSWSRKGTD